MRGQRPRSFRKERRAGEREERFCAPMSVGGGRAESEGQTSLHVWFFFLDVERRPCACAGDGVCRCRCFVSPLESVWSASRAAAPKICLVMFGSIDRYSYARPQNSETAAAYAASIYPVPVCWEIDSGIR